MPEKRCYLGFSPYNPKKKKKRESIVSTKEDVGFHDIQSVTPENNKTWDIE